MGLLNFFKKLFGFEKSRRKRFLKTSKKKSPKKSQHKFKKKTSKKLKSTKKGSYKQRPKAKQKRQAKSISRKNSSRSKKLQKSSSKISKGTQKTLQEKEIGLITHYFGKISVGVIKLKAPLKIGDKIHIKGANTDFFQIVDSMQINHQSVSCVQKGQEVGIKIIQKVRQNDKVYKVVY